MKYNKFSLILLALFFCGFSVYILINGNLTYKGVYIDGILAYIISFINLILSISLLYLALQHKEKK